MIRLKTLLTYFFFGMLAALILVGVGFVYFVSSIPEQQPLPPDADAIVVLTGGSSRIADAMRLLQDGHGRRLLISGVHQQTSRQAISAQMPEFADLFDCCVDLGRFALNTAGNAQEALDWAEDQGFRRLIIVTSNYHMPRSLAEFGNTMPDVELIPYPVVPDGARGDDWWRSPATIRLMMLEYIKYLAVLARQQMHMLAAGPLFGGNSGRP